MKPVSPRRAATRARLIEAAAAAVVEKGFRETTLDAIAARAGMTKGAIYDNFASKEDLFVAVMSCNPGRLPIPENPQGSTSEKLAAMARAVTADTEADRLQNPLRAEFLLYTLSHPEMRETMHSWLQQGFSAEEHQARAAFAPGELPLSHEAFVVMMEAMIPGLMYLRSQSPDLVNEKVVAEIFAALSPKA
ncbi:MAG: TetR/AcrR family transcriptional regulator [Alphaproteobacteria bacterium]